MTSEPLPDQEDFHGLYESCTLARRTALRERDEARADRDRLADVLRTIVAFHVGGWPDSEDQKTIYRIAKAAVDEMRPGDGRAAGADATEDVER